MKSHIAHYLHQLDMPQTAPVKGHFLPFGTPHPCPGKGVILLAGDAAGLVDPVTGEGLGYAIRSGKLAAQSAKTALDQGDSLHALALYSRATAPIRRDIRHANRLRPLMFSPRLQPFFARRFAASTRLKRDFMRLLAGEITYPKLLTRTLLRLPNALWRDLQSSPSDH